MPLVKIKNRIFVESTSSSTQFTVDDSTSEVQNEYLETFDHLSDKKRRRYSRSGGFKTPEEIREMNRLRQRLRRERIKNGEPKPARTGRQKIFTEEEARLRRASQQKEYRQRQKVREDDEKSIEESLQHRIPVQSSNKDIDLVTLLKIHERNRLARHASYQRNYRKRQKERQKALENQQDKEPEPLPTFLQSIVEKAVEEKEKNRNRKKISSRRFADVAFFGHKDVAEEEKNFEK
ncbi:unnamed protein product [Caenorhabditis auriculariae]|uniref:Uncharacterized protein n=1 Tax=Caenorhabditis auriculariae TaxID=2777116 RepID=A0A8S1H2T4_9PELO|nr:unnamed protein product [Caenorhabditis auriculariae]